MERVKTVLGCRNLYQQFGNCTLLCHFTDQTLEATNSKFGLRVLYSIRTKMEIIKSVLIKNFY